jgi:hypothetical protein
MFKARDCTRWLLRRAAAWLGLGLCLVDLGCSGMSGFRSVGTDRPSFLGLWDRPAPGSPTADNDLYAQNMRSRVPPELLAKYSGKTGTRRATDTPGQTDQLADGAKPADPDQVAARTKPPGRAETPDVSLGRPEPLPGLLLADQDSAQLASRGSKPRWKAGNNEPAERDDRGPTLAAEAESSKPASTEAMAGRTTSPPAEPSSPADRSSKVDANTILARAEARLGAMKTYQVKITRLERVSGTLQPEEDILVSIKRDPKSVRLEWASGPNKGREVIYSSTLDPRVMFVHMPTTALPLPAMKIAIDSPLATRNSRHAITEAGFDTIVANFRKSAKQGSNAGSDPGALNYRGLEKPAGLDRACHHFARRTASGETWNIYLDQASLLPRMVVAEDPRGELVERDIYREIRENPSELAAASAFEPEKRWGDTAGLLGRFARAATGASLPASGESATR